MSQQRQRSYYGNRTPGPVTRSAALVAEVALLNQLDATRVDLQSDTFVQKIAAAELSYGGDQVALLITTTQLAAPEYLAVGISQVAASGDAWDSASDLTEVTFNGGNSGLTTSINTAYVSDWINYKLDPAQDLLVSFDVTTSAGGKWVPINNAASANYTAYTKATAAEALTQDRSSGWTTVGSNIYGLAGILVRRGKFKV